MNITRKDKIGYGYPIIEDISAGFHILSDKKYKSIMQELQSLRDTVSKMDELVELKSRSITCRALHITDEQLQNMLDDKVIEPIQLDYPHQQ